MAPTITPLDSCCQVFFGFSDIPISRKGLQSVLTTRFHLGLESIDILIQPQVSSGQINQSTTIHYRIRSPPQCPPNPQSAIPQPQFLDIQSIDSLCSLRDAASHRISISKVKGNFAFHPTSCKPSRGVRELSQRSHCVV